MRRLLYIIMCLTCSMLARAQSTYQYRYWFDGDERHSVTVDGGSRLSVDIPLDGLQEVLHTLHVQVSDTAGVASSPRTLFFVKSHVPTQGALRYWFDADADDGGTMDEGASLINVSQLPYGIHTLHVQKCGNSPSAVFSSIFLKIPQVEGVERLKAVTYIDGALVQQEDLAPNGGVLHYNFDATGLSEGVHLLSAQVVEPSGVASGTKSSYFLRTTTAAERGNMQCFYAIDGERGFVQAGQFANGTFHFDIDVAGISNGLHRLTYMVITEGGTASAMRTAFFMKTPLGGNGISAYHYWLNSDYEGRRQVKMDKNVNPLNLMSLLPVESVPLRSSQFHFEWKDGKPMIYAQNDFHIRFYDAANRCVDQCKDYTDYSVSREITDAELLVPGTPMVKDKPAENEIQWYHFPAAIGDSLAFKVDRACTVQLFAPSGKEVYNASGSDVVNWGGIHAWEDGEYYLALHDVTAQQGKNTKLELYQLAKYAVLSHTPDEVGAAPGYFHITIFGNGYDKLKRAVLCNGESFIVADTCMVGDISNAMLEFYMPSEEQLLGNYDLKLYFNDGSKANELIVPKAVRVTEAVYGNIDIAISSQRRVAKPYPVTIKVTNKGNTPYQMVPLIIGMDHPEKLSEIHTLNFDVVIEKNGAESGVQAFVETDNLLNMGVKGIMIPTIIPQLNAGETIELQIGFVTAPHALFKVYAWTFTPWSIHSDSAARKVRSKARPLPNPTCDMDPCASPR